MAGSHDRDTWLWVGGALIAIGVTAAAIGGGFAAARDGYDIWTSEPFIVAYVAFSLALICLVGAIRDWRFPFSTRPDPRPRTSNRVETKRPTPSRVRRYDALSTSTAVGGSALVGSNLQSLLNEGVALKNGLTGSHTALVPFGVRVATSHDVDAWEKKVRDALAGRPLDLAHFLLDVPLAAIAGLAAGETRARLDWRLRKLEDIIRGVN